MTITVFYFSEIPRTCVQKRFLYTLNNEKSRLNNAKQTHFLECKNIGNTNVFFYSIKNRFFKIWYGKKTTFKKLKDDLKNSFSNGVPSVKHV